MSRFYTSQPENGDVTPTVRQLHFNLAEETVWNVITASTHTLCCVCWAVCLFLRDVCVMFNSFHSIFWRDFHGPLSPPDCLKSTQGGRSKRTAGEQPKMVTAPYTHESAPLIMFPGSLVICKHRSVPFELLWVAPLLPMSPSQLN